MIAEKPSIFRKEALEKYLHEQEKAVSPRLVPSRRFLTCWILFAVLSVAAVGLCFAQVPIYASGLGILTATDGAGGADHLSVFRVAALFPKDVHSQLKVGKRLMIRIKAGARRRWLERPIVAVAPDVLGYAEAQREFSVNVEMGGARISNDTDEVALCWADLEPRPSPLDGLDSAVVKVRVRVGSRRLAAFLPVLSEFFKK
jgi:hypothetical protein